MHLSDMKDVIYLKDVLEIMQMKDEAGMAIPFDIEVRQFSAQNSTGGKYVVYNDARLLRVKPSKKTYKSKVAELFYLEKKEKNPNHFANSTRNIELANGEIKKINIRFIIKFNGKKVCY